MPRTGKDLPKVIRLVTGSTEAVIADSRSQGI
jgi:hypothetical protein